MPNIGPVELIIVLVIALLVLGPGRLPEVGSAFGKTIREFRKASTDIQEATTIDTRGDARPTAGRAAAMPEPNTLRADPSEPNTLRSARVETEPDAPAERS